MVATPEEEPEMIITINGRGELAYYLEIEEDEKTSLLYTNVQNHYLKKEYLPDSSKRT